MIRDNKKTVAYLESVVSSVFKILPLYEEKNEGLSIYIESLIFELDSFQETFYVEESPEYGSLMSTLRSLQKEVSKEDSRKSTIRREVFKCINITKNLSGRIGDV